MIELRWMERERELDAFVMEGSRSRTYFVLQFRTVGRGMKVENNVICGLENTYSEWQDVEREYLPAKTPAST